MDDWRKAVLEEIQLEIERNDPFYKRVRYVEFLSRSNGRGRPRRRRLREIIFLVIDGIAFQVKDGEIKSRRNFKIDSLANEILTDLSRDERTVDALLEKAKTRAKRK